LAPIIEHNTVRVKTRMRAFGLVHTYTTRYTQGTTANVAQTANAALWENLLLAFPEASIAADLVVLSCEYSPDGDPNFYPLSLLPATPTGEKATGTTTLADRARHTKFNARGGGRNCSIELFGVYWPTATVSDPASKGYVTAAENGPMSVAIGVLQASGLRTVANVQATWKAEASVKVNDYWFNEQK